MTERGRPGDEDRGPQFADAELDGLFSRYHGGDTSLREQVFAAMREAFHRADVEAGEA